MCMNLDLGWDSMDKEFMGAQEGREHLHVQVWHPQMEREERIG